MLPVTLTIPESVPQWEPECAVLSIWRTAHFLKVSKDSTYNNNMGRFKHTQHGHRSLLLVLPFVFTLFISNSIWFYHCYIYHLYFILNLNLFQMFLIFTWNMFETCKCLYMLFDFNEYDNTEGGWEVQVKMSKSSGQTKHDGTQDWRTDTEQTEQSNTGTLNTQYTGEVMRDRWIRVE